MARAPWLPPKTSSCGVPAGSVGTAFHGRPHRVAGHHRRGCAGMPGRPRRTTGRCVWPSGRADGWPAPARRSARGSGTARSSGGPPAAPAPRHSRRPRPPRRGGTRRGSVATVARLFTNPARALPRAPSPVRPSRSWRWCATASRVPAAAETPARARCRRTELAASGSSCLNCSARATAGKRWPPVPPPASSSLIALLRASCWRR